MGAELVGKLYSKSYYYAPCWEGISNGVSQESVLGLVLLNIFINNGSFFNERMQSILIKFDAGIKLWGVASTLDDWISMQNDLDRMKKITDAIL